jgi:hypothetical protein
MAAIKKIFLNMVKKLQLDDAKVKKTFHTYDKMTQQIPDCCKKICFWHALC